jgi:hypothetical protein
MRPTETAGLLVDDLTRAVERLQGHLRHGAPAEVDAEVLEIVTCLRDLERHLIASGGLDADRIPWRPLRLC